MQIAMRQHVLEKSPRLVFPSERAERVDVPEGADEKRVLRRAKIVALVVAWPLLNEVPTVFQAVGAATIIAGVFLTRT